MNVESILYDHRNLIPPIRYIQLKFKYYVIQEQYLKYDGQFEKPE